MQRPNFFYWYYNQGIWELLEIWKNFLFFVWRYFSVFELFKTLLCPWHRDISVHNWRGLHPFRTFELILENTISSFIGAIIRLVVICIGIMFFLAVLIIGIIMNFLWISAPLVILFFFAYAIKGSSMPLVYGGFILIWIIFSVYCYFCDTEIAIVNMGLDEILNY